MRVQLFLSTFVLIFLAELGDKTQLAAMARAASSGSAKWTIFFAASAALVFSTLVAVLVGEALTRVIPEKYIRMGAGVLFVLFGVLIVRDALAAKPAAAEAVGAVPPSRVASVLLRGAAELEHAAFEDYSRLAEDAALPALKALLLELAHEEEQHFQQLVAEDSGQPAGAIGGTASAPPLPVYVRLKPATVGEDLAILRQAIRHEESTAGFYRELARLTPVPGWKRALISLAEAEQGHAERLRALQPEVQPG